MDDKKFQKAIDIMLQQMATTHATGEETKEKQKEHEKRINGLERAAINLYNATIKQGEHIDKQGEHIDKQGEQIDKISADLEKVVEVQKETNERLNAVIFMAEKYFSGENGSKKK